MEQTAKELVEHVENSGSSNTIIEWVNRILCDWGCTGKTADLIDEWILLIMIILLALAIDLVLRHVVLRLARKLVQRTKASWDDMLFEHNVLARMCRIAVPLTLYALLPLAFPNENHNLLTIVLQRGVEVYIVIAFVRFFNSLIKMVFEIADKRPSLHGRPIKGLMQTGQVILLCVAAILIISIIINKSPVMLLTGIGASAAVLMLIFQNSILGLVAGIQLSANKMLKVGDWISMPKHGVDGTVEEVALTTVKIRAWDNTLQTIPPNLLISEPFDNWQAMFDAGGRRIKRSLNIDMTSIKFADNELIERLAKCEHTQAVVESIEHSSEEGATLTNIDLFVRAMKIYISTHARVNQKMISMVRQLQPTQWGLPIEIYCFSADTRWIYYEGLQAEIIAHVVALAPYFDLKIYQAPSSYDVKA